MAISSRAQITSAIAVAACISSQAQTTLAVPASLPAGSVLRVQVDHRSRIKIGNRVQGHLTEPMFLRDHLVIPAGAEVSGVVRSTHPAKKGVRASRLMNGDFTPPRLPDVIFDQITLPASADQPARSLSIDAPALDRNASVVRLGTAKAKKVSLASRATDMFRSRKDGLRHANKTEFLEKYVLNQLPYHPLMIWTNDGFDGTLNAPALIAENPPFPLPLLSYDGDLPKSALHARLTSPVNSADAVKGATVHAIVTEPLFSADGKGLLVAEGTEILGTVVQVQAARKYGHNGKLRFTFSHIQLGTMGDAPTDIHGHLSSTEADGKDHLSLDEEGQAKASDGPAKYAEPALLAILAFASVPDDKDTGGSGGAGGFGTGGGGGLIGRVVASAADPALSEGLAAFALSKSVYVHFIAKGHETTFPTNTRVEISLSER